MKIKYIFKSIEKCLLSAKLCYLTASELIRVKFESILRHLRSHAIAVLMHLRD